MKTQSVTVRVPEVGEVWCNLQNNPPIYALITKDVGTARKLDTSASYTTVGFGGSGASCIRPLEHGRDGWQFFCDSWADFVWAFSEDQIAEFEECIQRLRDFSVAAKHLPEATAIMLYQCDCARPETFRVYPAQVHANKWDMPADEAWLNTVISDDDIEIIADEKGDPWISWLEGIGCVRIPMPQTRVKFRGLMESLGIELWSEQ